MHYVRVSKFLKGKDKSEEQTTRHHPGQPFDVSPYLEEKTDIDWDFLDDDSIDYYDKTLPMDIKKEVWEVRDKGAIGIIKHEYCQLALLGKEKGYENIEYLNQFDFNHARSAAKTIKKLFADANKILIDHEVRSDKFQVIGHPDLILKRGDKYQVIEMKFRENFTRQQDTDIPIDKTFGTPVKSVRYWQQQIYLYYYCVIESFNLTPEQLTASLLVFFRDRKYRKDPKFLFINLPGISRQVALLP